MTAVMDAGLVLTFLVMMLVSWLPVGMTCGALLLVMSVRAMCWQRWLSEVGTGGVRCTSGSGRGIRNSWGFQLCVRMR
jgi:hypothetical protein